MTEQTTDGGGKFSWSVDFSENHIATDQREFHIRALCLLMNEGKMSEQLVEYLNAREYGLALDELAYMVNHNGR